MLLEGLRVLEVSHAVAGPTACQILADLGAEVIKIERPQGGDIFRNTPGMGASMFLAVNRGKKSVTIDLKTREGLGLFYSLVKKSDVLVENLSPGTAGKLGITYERVRRTNNRIVHCMIESFGRGPYESTPAFDPVLQAAVGIMSTTGFPPNKYARAGVSMVDMSTGIHAAVSILAMIHERTKTGKGGLVEVPLYDAAAYYMSYWVTLFDLEGKDTRPLGSTHVFGAPYNLFPTRDGWIYIATANDEAWNSFCYALSFSDLLKDRRYKSNRDRVENKAKLEGEVSRRLSKLSTKQVLRSLSGTKVPFAKLNTARSLLEDPHFRARRLAESYTYSGRKFRTIVNPALINGTRAHTKSSPPQLGEHTHEVLRTLLKLSISKIKALEKARAI